MQQRQTIAISMWEKKILNETPGFFVVLSPNDLIMSTCLPNVSFLSQNNKRTLSKLRPLFYGLKRDNLRNRHTQTPHTLPPRNHTHTSINCGNALRGRDM